MERECDICAYLGFFARNWGVFTTEHTEGTEESKSEEKQLTIEIKRAFSDWKRLLGIFYLRFINILLGIIDQIGQLEIFFGYSSFPVCGKGYSDLIP